MFQMLFPLSAGMSTAQLHQLAEAARLGKVAKVSRRDLAYTLSQVVT